MTDMKEAASAAHTYGKPIVAAESFTTMPPPLVPAFAQGPYYLKRLADRALAQGINRFVIHTSVHQPFVDEEHKPGMTLGPFGQHFSRNTTWAEQSSAWLAYLARASHLLQQGRFVADLVYFNGEGAPNAVPYWKPLDPAPPDGFDYDWVSAELLLNRMTVEAGRIVLPSGMRYRALVLPADVNRLTLPMAKKLRALVSAGAILIAPPPVGTPSLRDGAAGDDSVRAIASARVGRHRRHDRDVERVRRREGVLGHSGRRRAQRRSASRPTSRSPARATRSSRGSIAARRTPTSGSSPISRNGRSRSRRASASSGRPPSCGIRRPVSRRRRRTPSDSGRTEVPIALDPYGSTFVVFRRATTATRRTMPPEIALDDRHAVGALYRDVRARPRRAGGARALRRADVVVEVHRRGGALLLGHGRVHVRASTHRPTRSGREIASSSTSAR